LVIPKKHYRFVYEVPNFSEYWQVVLKITKALQKVFSPYFITYVTHGLEVSHAHIHILPRKKEKPSLCRQ
jgi:histidine triad (HIT) family protein